MKNDKLKIGYALGGGGGKGGFQAGALFELNRGGISPDVISSISVGALNGIMVATDQLGRLMELWHTITDSDIRGKARPVRYGLKFALHKIGIAKPQIGYWSNEPLKKLLRAELINKRVHCDFYCGSVDPETNKFIHFKIPKNTVIYSGNVDNFVDMIVASTAIPLIFQPVKNEGRMLVDGGVHFQTPLRPLSVLCRGEDKMDYIIGVSHYSPFKGGEEIKDDLDMLKWLIPALLDQTAREDFTRFNLINRIARHHGGHVKMDGKIYSYYPSRIIEPMQPLSPSTRFHYKYAKKDFLHGREMVRGFTLEEIKQSLTT